MKIQDLAAVIGGIMKLILFIGDILGSYYNYHSRNDKLFGLFFDYYSENYHVESKSIKLSKPTQINTERNKIQLVVLV
jgi:hypothetical protein